MALFPPIVDSSMPAFAVTQNGTEYYGTVRIYFTNPELNPQINTNGTVDSGKIEQVQATVSYLSNNRNALNGVTDNNTYGVVNGIKFAQGSAIKYDSTKKQYYIQITNDATHNHCDWQVNTLYKVQLRFSTIRATTTSTMKQVENFSEWSTVTIIKSIIAPTVSISNISNGTISSQFADFNIKYNAGESSEKLKSYQILIYKGNILQLESDWFLVGNNKYTQDTNSIAIDKSLPYQFQASTNYTITLKIKTENDYQTSVSYTVQYTATNLNFTANTYVDTFINEEEGYIKVHMYLKETNVPTNSTFVLRRSSSKDNFLKWEDLFIQGYSNSANGKDYYYYDFTAQSGIAYRYMIQRISTSNGGRGVPKYDQATINEKATIAEWNHAFLWQYINNGIIDNLDNLDIKQLKLKFDLQLSNLNINIAESKTDTLGSKYPFIRRNGNMYYRSFPITGTIASQMDDIQFFIEKDVLNDGQTALYEQFKSTNKYYTNQYDYTYQRKFRQAVQQFLYNGKPKLYKSMQQGNILVRLMDISLTPKQQLGRLIYTFSATAYEIDQPIIDNYIKYNMMIGR